MGRPLNSKYFGNRNTGSPNTDADNGIGGEGVASVVVTEGGAYTGATTVTKPTATFSGPELPLGVTALANTLMGVSSIVVNNSGTGGNYKPTDTLTVTGGTGTSATLSVSNVKVRASAINNAGTGYAQYETLSFGGTNWVSNAVLTVDTVDGSGNITAVSITAAGVWNSATLPTMPITATGGNTATGTNAAFNLSFGINSLTVATEGSYATLANNSVSLSGGNGTGATANLTYKINGITITEVGSGYTAAPTITLSSAGTGSTPAFTVALTDVNTDAIAVSANIAGTTGAADIIRQVSSRRFLVQTAAANAVCRLVTTSPVSGEMRITATDSASGTYYVKKISGRVATLVAGSGTQFADGSKVAWTVLSPVANANVTLD